MQFALSKHEIKELAAAVAEEVARQQVAASRYKPLYTHEEAANLLGLCNHQLHIWRKEGRIKASRIGKRYLYKGAEIARMIDDNEVDDGL